MRGQAGLYPKSEEHGRGCADKPAGSIPALRTMRESAQFQLAGS